MYLQFRPLTGPSGSGSPTPNPIATRPGSSPLRSPTPTTSRLPTITGTPTSGYFLRRTVQRVCLSAQPQVASGTIESASSDGTTAPLPTPRREASASTCRRVRLQLLNIADAEYTSTRQLAVRLSRVTTLPRGSSEKASGMCRSTVASWIGEPFSASHAYSLSTTLSGSVNLAVFDGDSNTGIKGDANWYGKQRLAELHDHLPRPVEARACFTSARAPSRCPCCW